MIGTGLLPRAVGAQLPDRNHQLHRHTQPVRRAPVAVDERDLPGIRVKQRTSSSGAIDSGNPRSYPGSASENTLIATNHPAARSRSHDA